MYKSKKGRMMRHPYATLAVVGLAAAGAVSLTNKTKKLITEKSAALTGMMKKMKNDEG